MNTNVISTVTRDYDAANRLILDKQNVSGLGVKNVQYEYDEEGKATRLYVTPAVSGNYDYSFGYDQRDRFETITHAAFPSPYYQYYYDVASNELVRRNRANGVDQSYQPLDALNRMTRRDLIDYSSGTNLNAESYTYDPMSRITRVDRSANDDSVFTYYQDGEIKSGTYVAPELNPVSYVWDKAGNRTSITDGGMNKTYSPNGINQYTSAEGSTVTNGNDHEITAYAGVNYDYLNDGQLVQATSGTKVYKMAYDALGRCVKRTLNGAITYYLYDGEKPILEFDDSGNMVGFNVYGKGVDELIQRGAYGSDSIWHWYFPQQDHEGSVTHLTDENGAIIEKYKYDAFGQPVIYNAAGQVISNSAYNNRFLFTGREWAPKNLGFYEYRARAYHPGLGRFMSEDPKGFDAGDYNLYRYCLDDPINRTDPDGMFGIPLVQSISAADRMNLINLAGETSLQGNLAASALATYNEGSRAASGGTNSSATGPAVKSAKVAITGQSHRVDYVRKYGDKGPILLRGGKPLPAATFKRTWESTKLVDGGLELTYHLRLDVYYAMKAGPRQQQFAIEKEWEHTEDVFEHGTALSSAAGSLVGRSFATRTEAAAALGNAVNPVVEGVWSLSRVRDAMGMHTLTENGHDVDFYQ